MTGSVKTKPASTDLQRWLLGLLEGDAACRIDELLSDPLRARDALHQAGIELIAAYLDGRMSPEERAAMKDLLASCRRLQDQLTTTVRSRILRQEPIDTTDRALEVQVSSEVVNLCCAYRDRELTPEEETAFECLCEGSRSIRRLFDVAVDLKSTTFFQIS